MKASLWKSGILIFILATQSISAARADESEQPYIDELKKGLKDKKGSEGYSEELKNKLPPKEDSEGYSEQLRRENPLQLQGTPGGSYSKELKKELPPKEQGGAIEAFREGHDQLREIKSEDVHNNISIRVGLAVSRSATANDGIGTGRDFNSVYGNSYAPDLGLLVEHYLIQSEHFGTFGVFGLAEVAFYNGQGQFAFQLNDAATGNPIPLNATNVSFKYFEVPGTLGAFYRFNLAKYVRPYVMAGPNIVGSSETRNDSHPTHYALSYGFLEEVGVSIMMDWVNKKTDWDIYQDSGIKHTYFNFAYANQNTFGASAITYNIHGAYFGVVFEY